VRAKSWCGLSLQVFATGHHTSTSAIGAPKPIVLGHEGAGIARASRFLGNAARARRPGDPERELLRRMSSVDKMPTALATMCYTRNFGAADPTAVLR